LTGPVLDARAVEVVIRGKPILHGADLAVGGGELVAVVGPNGAGKSTLVRACAGIQRTSGGSVRWAGEDVRQLAGRRLARLRAFVPQRSQVPAGLAVRAAVSVGRSPHIGPLRRAGQADRQAVERAMARVGVLELAERRLTTLSGGELQRVQIAVALAQEAPTLIADEPTSHLDLGATAEAARLLRGLADDGLAIVLVLHDLALAAAIADRVVIVSEGRSVATGTPGEVFDPERLARIWRVDASLESGALSVAWLGGGR